ncbi:MAG: DUF1615 domain-containing protein [Burkholderiales bacterium]
MPLSVRDFVSPADAAKIPFARVPMVSHPRTILTLHPKATPAKPLRMGILRPRMFMRFLLISLVATVTGCATGEIPQPPGSTPVTAAEGRARVAALLPRSVAGRTGWATDIYAAMTAMEIPATVENVCAIVAITDQESSFRADPAVPGLSGIAWKEIDKQATRVGIPQLVVRGALLLPSSNGKSYSERLDTVKTERQLSEIFEDFIGLVPMGKTFFADRNPVRTGGPMQVSVAFAEAHAKAKTYPYHVSASIRHEVFTRRGGVYFGIAHLLDYPASYNNPIYRFADFNAGRYASRNAAFQNAVSLISGISLALDGDVVRYEQGEVSTEHGSTELAVRTLARRLDMTMPEIRRDLERGKTQEFERSRLYARVFALADKLSGKPVSRAVLPRILLQSPKITRKLTTEWFANRVDERYRTCIARSPRASL